MSVFKLNINPPCDSVSYPYGLGNKPLLMGDTFLIRMQTIQCIYQIQSIIKPNYIYIGSSINFIKRKGRHLYLLRKNAHHSPKLQHHYNKYGESDLVFSIVETLTSSSCVEIINREQYYLDTLKPYFNICLIAGSCIGRDVSEETKIKIGNKTRGRKQTAEEIEKRASLLRGRNVSGETKDKMSIMRKGEDNYNSKLKEEDVYLIRDLKDTMSGRALAKKFNVHQHTIWAIINGFAWQHI